MNKNYTSIIVLMTILFLGVLSAQETQKNFINYQGVARNAENQLMASEAMTVTIALKFGAANSSAVYEESHTITTDANGVFSLLIGNGNPVAGNYNALPWGSSATFVTVSMNGKEIGTTEMMAVPYAISAGNMKGASAEEVKYDNSTSGLTAATTQDAIDELVTTGSIDADTDASNEFQMLSFDSATNELSLSDGNSVTIPSGGTDADADPTNELQTISFDAASNKISLTDGGEITIPSGGTDADADPTNEIQDISLSGTALSISDGSTIDLAPIIPPGGTDNQELSFDETTKVLEIEDGNTVDLSSLFGSGSSHWTQEGDDIKYTSGKVAIGDIIPIHEMHIHGSSARSNLKLTHLFTGQTFDDGLLMGISGVNDFLGFDAQIMNKEVGNLSLGTNNSRAMTIDREGNIGIGTNLPGSKLEVNGDIKSSGKLEVDGNIKTSGRLEVEGEINRSGTGDANMVPIAYGYIDKSGEILSGSGNFTVSKFAEGQYRVTIPEETGQIGWVVSITINGAWPGLGTVSHGASTARIFNVKTFRLLPAPLDSPITEDLSFSFVVFSR